MTKKQDAQTFRIERSGDTTLVFDGELLVEQSGLFHKGRECKETIELFVYRTKGGKYVARRSYHPTFAGEAGRHDVKVFEKTDEIIPFFRAWDPDELKRFGAGISAYAREDKPELEAKNAAIFEKLRDIYQYRIAEVFKALGLEERIE
jgi:hypothetical protein